MAELFATCLLFDYPAVKLSFLDLVKLRMKNENLSTDFLCYLQSQAIISFSKKQFDKYSKLYFYVDNSNKLC